MNTLANPPHIQTRFPLAIHSFTFRTSLVFPSCLPSCSFLSSFPFGQHNVIIPTSQTSGDTPYFLCYLYASFSPSFSRLLARLPPLFTASSIPPPFLIKAVIFLLSPFLPLFAGYVSSRILILLLFFRILFLFIAFVFSISFLFPPCRKICRQIRKRE